MNLTKRLSRAGLATALIGMLLGVSPAAFGQEEGPRLESIERTSPSVVGLGESVSFSYTTSGPVEPSNVHLYFFDSWGGRAIWGEAGTVSEEVTRTWRDGRYELRYVSLRWEDDSGGSRSTTYDPDGTVSTYPDGESEHSIDLSGLDFEVDNPDADTAPPLLVGLENLNGTTFDLNDEIRIGYDIVEEGSLTYISITLRDPSGRTRYLVDSEWDGIEGFASDVVGRKWENGSYTIESVYASDDSSNTAYYYAGGFVSNHPYNSAPNNHAVDFSEVQINVDSPGADPNPPQLMSLGELDEKYFPGEMVVLPYEWSDVSDLSAVVFVYEGQEEEVFLQARYPYSPTQYGEPDGSLEIPFGRLELGVYTLKEVYVVDEVGNAASYKRDGTYRDQQLPSSGTHELPFLDSDFELAEWPHHYVDRFNTGSIWIDFDSGKFTFLRTSQDEAIVRRSSVSTLPNGHLLAQFDSEDFTLRGMFDASTDRFTATILRGGDLYQLVGNESEPSLESESRGLI